MGAVDNGAFIPALKTRGPRDVRQPFRDRSFSKGNPTVLQGGDGELRILLLLRSGQGDGTRRE